MKQIATIRSENLRAVFVLSYCDTPFAGATNGTCRFSGGFCEFDSMYHDDVILYRIYSLNPFEKIRWLCRQWAFEQCVGYHWSYEKKHITSTKPKFLQERLFDIYYRRCP